jgi:hypothetical protein
MDYFHVEIMQLLLRTSLCNYALGVCVCVCVCVFRLVGWLREVALCVY